MEAHAEHTHHHEMPTEGSALTGVAVSATLHCLTGCAIGEVAGMAIGTALGFSDLGTIALAVALAFLFGYALTSLPLLRAGLALSVVIPIALASDTISIATMEVVDNVIMVVVPGAMEAGLSTLLFWGALSFALAVAFVLTIPVNRYLIARGKGHTAVHNTGIHGGPPTRLVGAAVIAAAAFGTAVLVGEVVAGDGNGHGTGTGHGDSMATSSDVDGAFLAAMKPHHESAIEMAQLAQERAEHPEIRQLAASIIATQAAEIETLDAIHERLYGEPIGPMSHGSLGLPEHEMGMDADLGVLETAEPFDREFIAMMIPHHEGAIRMARIELADGEDGETKALAQAIIEAQSREITQMSAWRAEWYDRPSSGAGVPPGDEVVPPADGMEDMGTNESPHTGGTGSHNAPPERPWLAPEPAKVR